MTPKKIECKYSEIEQIMLPRLRGHVFHVTNEKTFEAVCRSGSITSKEPAHLAFTWKQLEESYGRKRGWISLYDLRNTIDAEVKETLLRYCFLRAIRNETTHVYLVVAESAWPSLISWKRASREIGRKEFFVPFVEAWYPGDVPLEFVADSFVVTYR